MCERRPRCREVRTDLGPGVSLARDLHPSRGREGAEGAGRAMADDGPGAR